MRELANQLGRQLAARKMIVTTAESCTGGGVAHAITMIPGSSGWFELGFVTYSNHAKHQQLGVDTAMLLKHGAVSEEVVKAMVKGALQISSASVGVAISGVAGPACSEEKPVGSVWFAWQLVVGSPITVHHQFAGNREAVRNQSVETALKGLISIIENNTV
jgi:nicotinamide-nucleotide amidase